jgi:hypothetical protein
MTKGRFLELAAAVMPILARDGNLPRQKRTGTPIPMMELVAAVVLHLAHDHTYRQLRRTTGISIRYLHKCEGVIMAAIREAVQNDPTAAIRCPSSQRELADAVAAFAYDKRGLNRFDFLRVAKVVGAGDGTLIPIIIRLPHGQSRVAWFDILFFWFT